LPDLSNPAVSIITPAYNAAQYLVETVDAALAQSFQDFELLLVDDGSTDETPALARALAERDRRIQVRTSPNQGPAAARNTAMAMARGRFFAMLDSDDIWAPDYLARQLRLLESFPAASIVTANAINLGGPFNDRPFWPVTSGVRTLALQDIIEQEDAVCIMSVFRRDVFDTIGGFDPRFTGNEDYEFWLRAAFAGFVVLQNLQPLGRYRRRDNSLSANEMRMLKGILRVFEAADVRCAGLPGERASIRRQILRFETQLARAGLRESLRQSDLPAALRSLDALSGLRPGLMLSTVARLSALWPTPLLWAYRVRCAIRSSRAASHF
jgi:teichuronic acid biosynthesis glycosyltransferase TuaG